MRRNEREIKDRSRMDAIIRSCKVCRLGLCDGDEPYIVPMSFGYDGRAVYLHCAREGRKLDIIRRNSRVCVEFDILTRLVESKDACDWGMRYQSVLAVGNASIVEDTEARRRALAVLMKQYSDKDYSFPEKAMAGICIIEIPIERLTGKQSVDQPPREAE